MSFDYHTYLASREWAVKREAVRKRCGNICERCHRAPHQHTHHLTYARVGHELLEDLLGVCAACHKFLSAKSTVDPLNVEYSLLLGAYEGGPKSSRIERLQRTASYLYERLHSGWWPVCLYDHKGDLTIGAWSVPQTLEERNIIGDAWEEECECRENVFYSIPSNDRVLIYDFEGQLERPACHDLGKLDVRYVVKAAML